MQSKIAQKCKLAYMAYKLRLHIIAEDYWLKLSYYSLFYGLKIGIQFRPCGYWWQIIFPWIFAKKIQIPYDDIHDDDIHDDDIHDDDIHHFWWFYNLVMD